MQSDKGSTKKSLRQVLKNANIQNMGFGESLGIAQSEFSNSKISKKNRDLNTGLSQGQTENPIDNFDWEFAIKELENEENLDLENILRTLKEPITSFYDENNLTLLHHAVLKGVDGKTGLLINFAK